MASRAHVAIIGGAAMGSSVACHLLMDKAFSGRVTVIEKDPTYARSATALSAASIRQQFSTRVNIDVSLYGIRFMRALGEHLAVDGDRPDIGLREGGYLYLATGAGADLLGEVNALQREAGADILLMDRGELGGRFPFLALDDIALGSWGRTGEGWYDGWGLLQAFRRKARALGAAFVEGEAASLEKQGDRIVAARLADGARVEADIFVNCAGAAGGRRIAALAGVDIPVYAKKRCVFSWTPADRIAGAPLLIDTSGAWCRPEGEGFIGGYSPDDGDERDAGEDFEVNWSEWEDVVWPALAARIPAFERVRAGRAWAGHYDMNLFDHNAIVGTAPGPGNFYLCNGYSGHGLQQSPAVGRGIAELIVHGRYLSLDLSAFAYHRILRNAPLIERNVI